MYKNIILAIIFITLLIFAVRKDQQAKKYLNINKSYEKKIIQNSFYYDEIDINYTNSGCNIKKDICSIPDTLLNMISKSINEKPVLIFRYDFSICSSCYKKEFEIIRRELKIPCIICSTEVNVDISFNNNPIIKINPLNLDIEKYNLPYFFVLYPNYKVGNFHLVNKNDDNLTKSYFKMVKQILSNW